MPSSPRSPAATSLARLITAFAGTWDDVAAAIGVDEEEQPHVDGQPHHLTHDQRLKALEIAALQSIAEELAAIRHHGLNPNYSRY